MVTTNWQDCFTAVGGPMPDYIKPSVWEKACPWGLQAPILPPFRFTDKSIIPVVVRLREFYLEEKKTQKSRPHSIIVERFTSWVTNLKGSNPALACVYMPRSEYLKYFAHDEHGVYIGSEPQRSWTGKELELEFGQYRDVPPLRWVASQSGGHVFMSEKMCCDNY